MVIPHRHLHLCVEKPIKSPEWRLNVQHNLLLLLGGQPLNIWLHAISQRDLSPFNGATISHNYIFFLSVRDLLLQDSEEPSKCYFIGIVFFMSCLNRFDDHFSENWGGPPALLQICVPQALDLSWPPTELIWGTGRDTRPKLVAN